MNNKTIFVRTGLGSALLDVPYGNISGDARRLLALIDGNTSVGGIVEKVPLSVQIQLDAIFAQLLSGQFIEEKAESGRDIAPESFVHAGQEEYQKTVQINPPRKTDGAVSSDAGSETKRRIELERELAGVRSQLAETKARQLEVEAVCHSLEQQVAAFERISDVHQAPDMQLPSTQAGTGIELHESLDNLNQLNQALLDKQNILDSTLKLRSFQMQLNSEPHPEESDAGDEKIATSHPNYKKLRGLEFFKGFANADLLNFLGFAKWQKVSAGDTILREGEVGMHFFVIVSGSVKVIRKGNELATLGWGDFFGEFAYLSGDEPVRSAQVVASTDCELLAVEPMDVEFSSVQMRLHVVEALLRGQVKRALVSSRRIDSLLGHLNIPAGHEPR